MTTLGSFARMAAAERGLVTIAILRADGAIHASLVNAGVLTHPLDGAAAIGFVTHGHVKIANLRARSQLTATVRSGGAWSTVEGTATLIGPDDPAPGFDADRLRLLLRQVYIAAGGQHDDWNQYDRVMAVERRTVVLVTPLRVYGN